jgi:hypothetical protein
MAPIKAREALIGKVVLDEAFTRELIENPAQAVKNAGIKLNAADLSRIEALSPTERAFMLGGLHGKIKPAAFYDNVKGI